MENSTKENQNDKNPLRIIIFILAYAIIVFGSILLADGLAKHIDIKESIIAGALISIGFLGIILACKKLRPKYSKSIYKPAGLGLFFSLLLFCILWFSNTTIRKAHWFTTNTSVYDNNMNESKIRERAAIESIEYMFGN